MEKCVLLVYPGLGKTYCAKQYNNVEDIRLSFYENKNVEKYDKEASEQLKGHPLEFIKNPNFPNNLIKVLKNALKSEKVPVMALKERNIEFLIEFNFDFAFVMPAKNKIDELRQQYISRGNSDLVIDRNLENINRVQKEIESYGKPIIYVQKGEHLSDIIKTLQKPKNQYLS